MDEQAAYTEMLLHFLYGKGFWYANPLLEIRDLTERQLLWIPNPNSLCILWQVGHIAHREQYHIGVFLKGEQPDSIPERYNVFGPEWASVDQITSSIDSIPNVFTWVGDVREESHRFISSLKPGDLSSVPPKAGDDLSIGHWLFITAAHTALHIGRIQMLRAMLEVKHERAC
jgi:hypothetical protein